MFGFTNPYIFYIVDQDYEYLDHEGITGGAFKHTLKMQATEQALEGIPEVGEFRMAYARSWEYDQSLIQDRNDKDSWKEKAWQDRVIHVLVSSTMIELKDEDFKETGWVQRTVNLNTLFRLTLPKAPSSEEFWSINVWPDFDAPIQLMDERFEFYDDAHGHYGRRFLVLRANQIGKHDVHAIATWKDARRIFIEVIE